MRLANQLVAQMTLQQLSHPGERLATHDDGAAAVFFGLVEDARDQPTVMLTGPDEPGLDPVGWDAGLPKRLDGPAQELDGGLSLPVEPVRLRRFLALVESSLLLRVLGAAKLEQSRRQGRENVTENELKLVASAGDIGDVAKTPARGFRVVDGHEDSLGLHDRSFPAARRGLRGADYVEKRADRMPVRGSPP
jgi:hypothetical protein